MTTEPTLSPEFKAFKNGVYDAIIHGSHDEASVNAPRHYYKRGYDFGMVVYAELEECVAKQEEIRYNEVTTNLEITKVRCLSAQELLIGLQKEEEE